MEQLLTELMSVCHMILVYARVDNLVDFRAGPSDRRLEGRELSFHIFGRWRDLR